MSVDKPPDPFGPPQKIPKPSQHKRQYSDESENAETKKLKQEVSLIENGPFKGLPVPLQKNGFMSMFPYVGCNEKNQKITLNTLKHNPSKISPEKRVHIGFSVWFNFDSMAVTEPAYGIICDYDDKVMDVYQGIGDCLAKSANRQEFVNHFDMFLNQNSEQLFGFPPTAIPMLFNIREELVRPGSWLSSEASFQVIKNLSQRGHLLFLNLDITDTTGIFVRLNEWINRNGLALDTLYTSNIVDWLGNLLKKQSYLVNLKTVSTPNTRFIEAHSLIPKKSKLPQPKQEPIQHVFQGIGGKELLPPG